MQNTKRGKFPPASLRWRRQSWLWVWAVTLWCGISTLLLGFESEETALLPGFVSNVFAACAMLVPLAVWARFVTSLPEHHKAPLWSAMLLGSVVGLAKGIVTYSSFSFLTSQHHSLIGVIQSAIAPMVIGMWLVPLFELVGATLGIYGEERELLISERVHDKILNSKQVRQNSELSEFVAAANARIDEVDTPEQLTDLLHDLAHFDVREMSHSLWQEQELRLTGFSLRSLAKQTIAQHRFPALALSAALFLSLLSFQYHFVSFWDALARTLLQTCIAFGGFLLGRRIPFRGRLSGPVVFFAIPICIAWSINELSVAVFGQSPAVNSVAVIGSLSVSLLATALIFGAVQTARQTHLQIRAELTLHHVKGINREADEMLALLRRRETAELLHGYVHNQLLKFALRLQQNPEESTTIVQIIKDLLTRLELGLLNSSSRSARNLPNLLQEIHDLWEGILDVQFRLSPRESALTDSEFGLLETILQELVTNAYRHGHASVISLSVDLSPQIIEVTGIDNGSGVTTGAPGLGSKIFDAATRNTWQLVSTMEGTVVSCHIHRQNSSRHSNPVPASDFYDSSYES